MSILTITKKLLGIEDVLIGQDSVTQDRNGTNYTINKLSLIFAAKDLATLKALDVTDVNKQWPAALLESNGASYTWSAASTATPDDVTVILSDTSATGRWLILVDSTISRGALVYSTSGASAINSTALQVPWDTLEEDTSSIYNALNNTRLTVPTGYTRIKLKAVLQFSTTAAGQLRGSFRKNGVAGGFVGNGWYHNGLVTENAFNATFQLASAAIAVVAGDYFEVNIFQDSGFAASLGTSRSWFAMELVE